ncbi:hypothetical protein BSKO_08592 [Bryopsis sp. KO-2023]|nr:hypothetical protein BSKO_08592 [Bryopsis sp. KO-2023]
MGSEDGVKKRHKHKEKKKKDKKSKRKSKHKERKHKKEDACPDPQASCSQSDGDQKETMGLPSEAGPSVETSNAGDVGKSSQPSMAREEWMMGPMARPHAVQKDSENVEGSKVEDKGWGVALDAAKKSKEAKDSSEPLPVVGDGGASWRLKALKRMRMRAENEGKSLQDIAESRGLDLDKLAEAATRTHAAHTMAHLSSAKDRARRYQQGVEKEGGKKRQPHYLDDIKSDRGRMKVPRVDERLSWNRDRRSDSNKPRNPLLKEAEFARDEHRKHRVEEKDGKSAQLEKVEVPRQQTQPLGGERPSSGGQDGNVSAAALLRAQLTGKSAPSKKRGAVSDDVVNLPLVDSHGRAVRGAFGRDGTEVAPRNPRSKTDNFHQDGSRKRYFDDDDDVDLKTLVKRSRYGDDTIDMDRAMAESVMRNKRYKEGEFDADAEYDFDAGIDLHRHRKPDKRHGHDKQKELHKRAQINDFKRLNVVEEECTLCFSCPKRPKHLVVSIATSAYLRLPSRGRLVPGHCMIVPVEHCPSSCQVDENVWTEMRNFKKALIQMFHSQGKHVLFLETVMHLDDFKRHAVVECIPVPPDVMHKAPLYFKKGIDDATGDWDQHHHKRCISTKEKGLRGTIPNNFPYFHVEFGIADGFVHVIDDESKFDEDFGRKVLCGLLKLPAETFHRKSRSQGTVVEGDWVREFQAMWAEYDWTLALQ